MDTHFIHLLFLPCVPREEFLFLPVEAPISEVSEWDKFPFSDQSRHQAHSHLPSHGQTKHYISARWCQWYGSTSLRTTDQESRDLTRDSMPQSTKAWRKRTLEKWWSSPRSTQTTNVAYVNNTTHIVLAFVTRVEQWRWCIQWLAWIHLP